MNKGDYDFDQARDAELQQRAQAERDAAYTSHCPVCIGPLTRIDSEFWGCLCGRFYHLFDVLLLRPSDLFPQQPPPYTQVEINQLQEPS